MRRLWEELCALPHRGSATAFEALAARKLKEHLETIGKPPQPSPRLQEVGAGEGLGDGAFNDWAAEPQPAPPQISVQTQTFSAPRSYGPELIFVSLLLALGGWLGQWPLALVGTYAFWAHFSGWWVPWGGLFDRNVSQNVLAQTGRGPRTLVLMAHYDTAKTFFLYDPRRVRHFRRDFLINAAFATVLPFATFLPYVTQLLGLYFLVQAGFMAYRELTQPYVNGANDNASGVVAAAGLFEELARDPLPGYRVVLALTGAEEVGAKGAEHLARSGLIPPGSAVLNLDNVGRGRLFYAAGEGMLVYHPFRGDLLNTARMTPGAEPLEYRLAFFDTRPFAARGFDCLTLIRLEDGLPPNWHWPSDTPENVEWAAVEETLAYARTLVRSLAVGRSGEAS